MVAMEAEGIRTQDGMALKAKCAEPLMKYCLCHKNHLNWEDLKRCSEFLGIFDHRRNCKEILEALAQHFCPDDEGFKQVVLKCYGRPSSTHVDAITEAVLESMDSEDRGVFKTLDEDLNQQRKKRRASEFIEKRKKQRVAALKRQPAHGAPVLAPATSEIPVAEPQAEAFPAAALAASSHASATPAAEPLVETLPAVLAAGSLAPAITAAGLRAPAHQYMFWETVMCTNCGQDAGQMKCDPSPGGRDKPTWHMRVKNVDGSWPTKGHSYQRRLVDRIGEATDYCVNWILGNRTCC